MKHLVVGCMGAIAGLLLAVALFFIGTSIVFIPGSRVAVAVTSERPALSVNISASYIALQYQQLARQSGVGKDATMTLAAPNLIRVTMPVQTSLIGVPINARATITMRVSAKEGRVVLIIESVDMGGIAVPPRLVDSAVEQARAQAEEQVNRVVQSTLRGTNLRVSNIRITESDLTIELNGQ